jgi:hypothetical protein
MTMVLESSSVDLYGVTSWQCLMFCDEKVTKVVDLYELGMLTNNV